MDYKRQILSYTRRAVDDYQMTKSGDKIAVGVSAGKDSLTLLCAMAALKRFYPEKFELEAITVDMGFTGGSDFSAIERLCCELDVPYTVVPSDIAKIVFDIRKEPNPCSLCAKLRRGALNNAAKERGCNKVALGHHWDDTVETFMLNLFFEGRIGCFSPVTYLSRIDLTVIRPMIYMPEKTVKAFAKQAELPVITSSCPADKSTEREQMKSLLNEYEHRDPRYKGLRNRIFNAIQKAEIDGFKMPETRLPAFSEDSDDVSKAVDGDKNSEN
jgi:tRNA(Ile)-lysidine synthase TilS/MesJ